MSNDFYEVIKNGTPMHYLFFTPEQAWEWVKNHRDGGQYDVQPFKQM